MGQLTRALISVADKRGIAELAAGLEALGIEILSTGGTARLLRQRGVRVADVASSTGFPELLDGRVKTLHPALHAALLALRDNPEHLAALERHGIRPIDLVVVNLAPFEQVARRADCTVEEAMETIDIGGAAILRSAAKNHRFVGVVCDPDDYERVLQQLRERGGLSTGLRAELALKAFRTTTRYDRAIAAYLAANVEGRFPSDLSLGFVRVHELRYGENPHQAAALYREHDATEPSAATATLLAGNKALSCNNVLDLDAALELVKEFEGTAAAIIKHTNPCGVALGDPVVEAFERAYAGDPVAAFGGVLAVNRRLGPEAAERIIAPSGAEAPKFFEVIVAPDFDEDAIAILTQKPRWGPDARILKSGPWTRDSLDRKAYDLKRIVGGLVVQDRDLDLFEAELRVVTQRRPTDGELRDLRFAAACAKHAKSNAIVLAKGQTLVGVGAGQVSRIDAALFAAHKAGPRARGAVLASDGFLAFPDVIEVAARAGCTAILQPGGAQRDPSLIARADALGLAMVFCGLRHFRY
jgi:phosphoribosylaminoimidazolecarboxamide formyltransferase/IMP cyclohydrolase